MNPNDVRETQAFFAERAAGWDARFPDDTPQYERACAELACRPGGTVLDLGCGTGRALEHLRRAVGTTGTVIGLDLTYEMLAAASTAGRRDHAALVNADGSVLPLRDRSIDAIFAAGSIHHLAPDHGLGELARVARRGARLAIFHPIGRAALAARHGRSLGPEDLLDARNLGGVLEQHGWQLDDLDDSPIRYLAVASRS